MSTKAVNLLEVLRIFSRWQRKTKILIRNVLHIVGPVWYFYVAKRAKYSMVTAVNKRKTTSMHLK